ncbi:hypothetical protein [Metabacillus indicus]|nr:hypothetical protein [Metabacillus indicus]
MYETFKAEIFALYTGGESQKAVDMTLHAGVEALKVAKGRGYDPSFTPE